MFDWVQSTSLYLIIVRKLTSTTTVFRNSCMNVLPQKLNKKRKSRYHHFFCYFMISDSPYRVHCGDFIFQITYLKRRLEIKINSVEKLLFFSNLKRTWFSFTLAKNGFHLDILFNFVFILFKQFVLNVL